MANERVTNVTAASAEADDSPASAGAGVSPASAGKAPRTERGRKTLRAILDAAAAEFGEKGFHEGSISGITRRAGVALGSFYTYFDSKDAVFRALVRDMSEQVREHVAPAIRAAPEQIAAERAGLQTFIEFVRDHKEIYRIIDESEFVDAVLQQERDLAWTPIRPPVRLSMLNGRLDADNVIGLGPEQPENAICEDAEARGVSVVLSGWGGDEAASFGGKGALTELLLSGRWRKLAREVSALGRATGVPKIKIWYSSVFSPLWRAALPAPLVALADRIAPKRRPFRDKLAQLLTPAARNHLVHNPAAAYKTAPSACENRWRLSTGSHISERTEVWAQIGASHGLAFAFPLLDRRVVEFALSLPSELFVRDGYDRRPFRDAMVDVMDYLLGRNPLDQSFISGFGARPLHNPHHRFWAHSLDPPLPGPPPGVVSGGPNNGRPADDIARQMPPCTAAMRCWKDHIFAYSLNEVAINWNAPLVWVSAYLDNTR